MIDKNIIEYPRQGLIYLAAPYSHEDPSIVSDRVKKTAMVAGILIRSGRPVVAPTVTGHAVDAVSRDKIPYSAWIENGLGILANCWSIYVLCIDGWEHSNGVRKEVYFANAFKIPVLFCSLSDDGNLTLTKNPPESPSCPI